MTRRLRERQAAAGDEAPPAARPWRLGPYDAMSGWGRGLVLAAAVGLFLAFSGAFGTIEASLPRRLVYWLGVMAPGALLGGGLARLFFPLGGPAESAWRLGMRCVLASLVMAAPFTVLAWGGSRLILQADIPADRLLYLFGPVFMVALVMTALNLLLEIGRPVAAPLADAPPAPAAPPRFLERLPPRLRGAELWAVEAQDHYLRLHTSRGQDLILMRLADALAELEGLDGAQTHRSWWVARLAVRDVRRGDGRAVLTLPDGTSAPVSRSFAPGLRAAGWY